MYSLSGLSPVAEGGEKYIYRHPHNQQLLIKVWKKRYYNSLVKRYPFIHHISRAPQYISLSNEIAEHIVSRGNNDNVKHLQEIKGICDTDKGLGLIVKAIEDGFGNLAPTLGDLLEQKRYSEFHHKKVYEFNSWLRHSRVIIRDLSLNNIVWDEPGKLFVVIDGIGARPLPSLRQFSALYNKRANNKRAKKLLSRVMAKID